MNSWQHDKLIKCWKSFKWKRHLTRRKKEWWKRGSVCGLKFNCELFVCFSTFTAVWVCRILWCLILSTNKYNNEEFFHSGMSFIQHHFRAYMKNVMGHWCVFKPYRNTYVFLSLHIKSSLSSHTRTLEWYH